MIFSGHHRLPNVSSSFGHDKGVVACKVMPENGTRLIYESTGDLTFPELIQAIDKDRKMFRLQGFNQF